MNFNPQHASALLALAVAGCNAANTSTPQLILTAPPAAITASGDLTLEVTARLHNPTQQPLQLSTGTSCSIFDWAIVSAGKVVQTEPNQLCAQMVANATLAAHSSTEQHHTIALDPTRYQANTHYTLNAQFWGYHNQHEFTLAD